MDKPKEMYDVREQYFKYFLLAKKLNKQDDKHGEGINKMCESIAESCHSIFIEHTLLGAFFLSLRAGGNTELADHLEYYFYEVSLMDEDVVECKVNEKTYNAKDEEEYFQFFIVKA